MNNKSNAEMIKRVIALCVLLTFIYACNDKPVTIDDPRNHPERYKKSSVAEKSQLVEVLKHDTYLNDLDLSAGMEITANSINMFYRTDQDTLDDIYRYVIDQKYDGENYRDQGKSYLHLIKNGDSLHYEILKNTRDVLRFKFMRDGNVHEYFPEKQPTAPPVVLPD
jgi:hypothetical protein